jgi:hypothetical protein
MFFKVVYGLLVSIGVYRNLENGRPSTHVTGVT